MINEQRKKEKNRSSKKLYGRGYHSRDARTRHFVVSLVTGLKRSGEGAMFWVGLCLKYLVRDMF